VITLEGEVEWHYQREDAEEAIWRVDASRISVEADGSEVILRGIVRTWAEREEAEHVAWRAPGVSKVDNRLSIDV
jgi:osmotically-inducible protein OsmY